jgi:DNA-binding GntR family transcriptional regulator
MNTAGVVDNMQADNPSAAGLRPYIIAQRNNQTPTEMDNSSNLNIIPRQSLQAEVVARLREEIVSGKWPPGARLQERVLCERFGVSRSPLREAFHVLVGENLLQLLPNRGAVVTSPTLEDAEQHFDLIVLLETHAVELACVNATKAQLDEIARLHRAMHEAAESNDAHAFYEMNNRVHRAIVEASNNAPLAKYHEMAARQLIRIQNLYGIEGEERDLSVTEHDKFIAPLLKRDATRAVAQFRKHLTTVNKMMHSRLKESAPSTKRAAR